MVIVWKEKMQYFWFFSPNILDLFSTIRLAYAFETYVMTSTQWNERGFDLKISAPLSIQTADHNANLQTVLYY